MAVAHVAVRDHCLAPERIDAPIGEGGRYGRLFDLPPLEANETLLHRLGAAGGFCDGGDCETDGRVEAGWPFFGQYVAHDLTADRSPLRSHSDLNALRNMRSPRANLESLYGGGPAGSPYLYRRDGEPFIPVEFADAAYRYGHSQIRQLYQLQQGGPLYTVFPDLIGFGPVGERRVDWSLLFDVPGRPPAQRSKPLDGELPRSLIELPQAITGAVDDAAYRSLAGRDLERGQGTGLPSGEAVARLIGAETLTEAELDLRRHGWNDETPLWLYILREASARHDGERLGEVGGRIVAEVLYGVIARDPESYLALDPDWTPTLPAREASFRLTDILVPDP